MLHLKLTRALGRGIMNATPSDVKDVQTRLKAIKHLGQPLYKGKIDGKDGKKTIDAICAFQTREKLPTTGCIKPGDKTAQKLRDCTPHSANTAVQAAIAGAEPSPAGLNPLPKQQAQKQIRDLEGQPIFAKERKALAGIISKSAEKHGLIVGVQNLQINSAGGLSIRLVALDTRGNKIAQSSEQLKAFVSLLKTIVSPVAEWKYGGYQHMDINTTRTFKLLRPSPPANAEFAKSLRLKTNLVHPVIKAIMDGVVRSASTFGPKSSKALFEFRIYLGTNNTDQVLRAFEQIEASFYQEPRMKDGDKNFAMQIAEAWSHDDLLTRIEDLSPTIVREAKLFGVDANLMKAIIYEEQSHQNPPAGGEALLERQGFGRTIGLGQITEGLHGFSRAQLFDDELNIKAIAVHLNSLTKAPLIQQNAPIASLATRYNSGSRRTISEYGRRVVGFYQKFEAGLW